jgi:tripartite-type tricarboxylate transporter receptor subunit TctC
VFVRTAEGFAARPIVLGQSDGSSAEVVLGLREGEIVEGLRLPHGQAAKGPADGYTILVTVNSYVINPALYTQVPYDPFRDFDPITLATTFSSGLLVHPSLPVRTVKELVGFAKANSDKLSFASPGFGTPSHLLGEQFRVTEHLDLVDVPFNGSGPAVTSVVAGHTPIGFAALSAAVVFAKDDKLRILAVMSKNRSPAVPDVPTIIEAGYPDLDGDGWIGVFVPAGTPRSVSSPYCIRRSVHDGRSGRQGAPNSSRL